MFPQAIGLDPTVRHIPKFGGDLWFVSAGVASSGDGKSPDNAFKTITEAITACSAGDAINIMAGTYVEDVDVNKNNVELWCEIGVVFDGTGTCLTISGDDCKINNGSDSCKITPATDQVGVNITGENCQAHNARVHGAADAGNSWNLAGGGAILHYCTASGMKAGSKAFNATTSGNKLYNCSTIGNTTSYGYYFDGTGTPFSNGLLFACTSRGHQSGGYYFTTGVSAHTILNCSTGGGSKWRDIDNANVWSNFHYSKVLYKEIDLDGNEGDLYQATAADGTHYNLFKVTGAVEVFNIHAHVEEVMPAIASVVNLELESDNNSVDITDAAGAPDLSGLVVGTVLMRAGAAGDPLLVAQPVSLCAVMENASYRAPSVPIVLVKDDSADTYIQMVCAAAMNGGGTGIIHWHVEYKPLTDDGFLEVV